MIPRWHIILGGIFILLIWILFPQIAWFNLILIFLASFLIDIDHYMCSVLENKSFSLRKALIYYYLLNKKADEELKKGIKKRGNFHVFHTIEFHLFVLVLSLWWSEFFYIFIGMVFHSFTDAIYMIYKKRLYKREFFLTNWLITKIKLHRSWIIIKFNYMKLTKPFAKSKNAGIQSKKTGRAKNIDNVSIREEKISTTLKTSPVKIKSPFRNKSPAQNNTNWK